MMQAQNDLSSNYSTYSRPLKQGGGGEHTTGSQQPLSSPEVLKIINYQKEITTESNKPKTMASKSKSPVPGTWAYFFTGVGVCSEDFSEDVAFLEDTPTWKWWQPYLKHAVSDTEREVLFLVALQTSLYDLWTSEECWDLLPKKDNPLSAGVAAHSLGELAAFYASGILPELEDVRQIAQWIADSMKAHTNGWMAGGFFDKNDFSLVTKSNRNFHLASTNFPHATDPNLVHKTFCGQGNDNSYEKFQSEYAEKNPKKLKVRHCWHHPDCAKSAPVKFPTLKNIRSGSFYSSSAMKKISYDGVNDGTVQFQIETYWRHWLIHPVDVSVLLDTVADSCDKILEVGAHPTLASFFQASSSSKEKSKIVPCMSRVETCSTFFILQQRHKITDEDLFFDKLLAEFGHADLNPEMNWLSQGLTSLSLTQLATGLKKYFPKLQPNDFYSYLTLDDLCHKYRLKGVTDCVEEANSGCYNATSCSVLVSGIGCWLPGKISSAKEALQFFEKNGDAVTHANPKGFSDLQCGYMEPFPFDYSKFQMRVNEAKNLDPQQQLALFTADRAVKDSKIDPKLLQGPRTGVYFGVWNQDFLGNRDSAYDVVGSNPSIISARISSHFDCRGPSVVLNTACASSLECMCRAVDDFRLGKIDYAIVGGVNVIYDPEFTQRMKRGGFLGDSQRCRTFDDQADGYVRSEGCVVFVLTRGGRSTVDLLDKSQFYGQILGGASNHNGHSPLITVPSAKAQSELLLAAFGNAGLKFEDLDYLECHGTGTRIGDPIELDGIKRAFSIAEQERTTPLYLGSAKANVGHLESAAGVTGVLRALLTLQNQTVYGNPLLNVLNPGLKCPDWIKIPSSKAEKAKIKNVGVSSFGFGGSNAHVLLGFAGEKKVSFGEELPLMSEQTPNSTILWITKKLPALAIPDPDRSRAPSDSGVTTESYVVLSNGENSDPDRVIQTGTGITTRSSSSASCTNEDIPMEHRDIPSFNPAPRMKTVASTMSMASEPEKLSSRRVHRKLFELIRIMGVDTDDEFRSLQELGLDSLSITDLFLQLDRTFGTNMNDGNFLIEGANVDKLAKFIIQTTGHGEEDEPAASSPALPARVTQQGSVMPSKTPRVSPSAAGDAAFQQTLNAWSNAAPGTTATTSAANKTAAPAACKADPEQIFECEPVEKPKPAPAPKPAAGKPKQLGFEDLESFDYYLTRPFAGKKRGILTTHVGSLPRSFGATSFDHIYQQIDIGLDIINDGEVHRASYADEVLSRLNGFAFLGAGDAASVAYTPHDVAECPNCARRFIGKSSLITLNTRFPALNPSCVGEVSYKKSTNDLKKYLDNYEDALRRNGTEPSSAFYSCPSPGTLALFFKNTHYKTDEEYLSALANALAVEYKEVVSRGFTVQVDCPDLAMGRHTQFQKMSDREFVEVQKGLIKALNQAVAGLPKEKVRVHICWGNYGFSHHRDIPLEKIVQNLNDIHCNDLLIENANPRHQHEIEILPKIRNAVITIGCVDTSSPHVESAQLIAQRICKLAQVVGPDRVKAGTDCGFATTSESHSNTEIVVMKLRALVMGARMASSILMNGVSLFQPRAKARLYWFGEKPLRNLPQLEIRHVPDWIMQEDVEAVARHMKSYTELPVFFIVVGKSTNFSGGQNMYGQLDFYEMQMRVLLKNLEHTPAYPEQILRLPTNQTVVFDKIRSVVYHGTVLDPMSLHIEDRYLEKAEADLKDFYEVVVIGAGLTGLHVASEMKKKGKDFALLEKNDHIGGIWKYFANERSQVNTSEAAYRLVDKVNTNKDHSTTREILTDAIHVATSLENRLFLKAPVTYVNKNGQKIYEIQIGDVHNGTGKTIRAGGVIMAINDRVGIPRQVKWKDEEKFRGEIRSGFSNDAADLDWIGKKVVIVGMGAFATENLRTALECGASSVTILARRHGTVCPKYIDYVNFVNKTSADGLQHDSVTNTKNMMVWRNLYEKTGAKMPECWMGAIKHYGHTISVSDIWFIGHHLRILDSLADEIGHFTEDGIVTKDSGTFLEADIVIRCTGFERNAQLIPLLTPYKTVNSVNYLDENFMYLADALIDDNVFNSVFGSSVMEMAKIFTTIYLYFFDNRQEYSKLAHKLKSVAVTDRKWSDYIAGLDVCFAECTGIQALMQQKIEERRHNFLKAHTVEEYIRENRREWNELHHILGVWSEQTSVLAYPKWTASQMGATAASAAPGSTSK
ncbi:unnamed protein product [Amoebophrya sp. A120]|nr:unnamed protein product [Amoebophrya sp. A120]|eukprot:GSA120T00008096001.1